MDGRAEGGEWGWGYCCHGTAALLVRLLLLLPPMVVVVMMVVVVVALSFEGSASVFGPAERRPG